MEKAAKMADIFAIVREVAHYCGLAYRDSNPPLSLLRQHDSAEIVDEELNAPRRLWCWMPAAENRRFD